MREFSRSRLLLCGLIAGMVIDTIQYLLDSFAFSENWDALAKLVGPATDPAAPTTFTLTATMIMFLMQLIGLAAGMLAVGLGALHFRRRQMSPALAAAIAWIPTYGLICLAIVLIARHSAVPAISAKPPLQFVNGVGFALSGLAGCLAGSWLGNWLYRESGQIADESRSNGEGKRDHGPA